MRWQGGPATRARFALSAGVLCLGLGARASEAEPDGSNLSRAHDAYARGAAAYTLGDFARAARELAFADALVPDDVTLKAALDSVTLADDPVLGVELIERAARVKDPTAMPALAHAVAVAEARFAHRTGRIVVRCHDCLALVDRAQVRAGAPRVVLVGVHLVAVQRGGAPEERLVTVAADETREVLPNEASAEHDATVPKGLPETVTNDQTAGLSPLWFVVGAATTVGLGVATIASAVDTLNDHGRFESFGCESSSAPGCAGLAATGRGAQTRTTWLAIGSGAALAGTAALGIFGVRWHRGGGGTVSAHLAGTTTALRVTF